MTNEELVKEIQQNINSCANMEALYINNRAYIYQIAKKYKSYTDIEDLMQEAYFGLYEAVQRFEDTHETKFITYAFFWIQQAIKRYIENNGRVVRMPSHLQNRILHYKKWINAYEVQIGRKPTDNELTLRLGVSGQQLKSIKMTISQYDAMKSLDTPIPGTEEMLLGEVVPDHVDIENNVIDKMMEDKINRELWEMVESNTTEEENKVVLARYKKNLSLEATGQSIGQSRDKARQIEARALRKLRLPKCRRRIEEKFEINYAKSYRGSVTSYKNDWTSATEKVALRNIEIESMLKKLL